MYQKFYVAYGSNLNVDQMRFRCPGAQVVGTAELRDWRLLFRGSGSGFYLTVEPHEGSTVPVVIWSVTDADERSLDRYEGYPRFYTKVWRTVVVRPLDGGAARVIPCFVYVMTPGRVLGTPTRDYFRTCMDGYRHFGFDPLILNRAVLESTPRSGRTSRKEVI